MIDTVEKERALFALVAVLLIAVGFLATMLFLGDDDDGDRAEPTADTAQLPAADATPVAERAGYVPDGCWPEGARIEPSRSDENVFLFPQWATAPSAVIDDDAAYTAVVQTNKGQMSFDLHTDIAPLTVNNFICLATRGFYDGVPFHRVIAGFMVQSGDPTGTGSGGPGYRFEDELPPEDRDYTRGTLAMANAGPDTQGSQFFIVHEPLDDEFPRNYTIFGQLIEGEDVLDDIADTTVVAGLQGENSRPVENVLIQRVIIHEVE